MTHSRHELQRDDRIVASLRGIHAELVVLNATLSQLVMLYGAANGISITEGQENAAEGEGEGR